MTDPKPASPKGPSSPSGAAPIARDSQEAAREPFRALITAEALQSLRAAGRGLVILDCSFDLADPSSGERAFAEAHLPGAIYAHLDRDLSGAKTGRNGRHPLPTKEVFAERAGAWGIGPATQVVAYDAQGGPYAARAWWMLHWLGHEAVAVLDGGPAAWRAVGGGFESGPAVARSRPSYPITGATMPTFDADALLAAIGRGQVRVVDARAGERYRGDVEPLDPVAGHIPGAINRFFKDNLGTDGRFKPAATLRAEYAQLGLADAGPGAAPIVHQCGSGVTACHNLLAMAHAGLPATALYPGSWSEWCADPARPVARG